MEALSFLSILPTLLSFSLLLVLAAPLAASEDNNENKAPACDCFLTNSSHPAYFTSHLFHDFRNLSKYAGIPPVLDSVDASAEAGVTSQYFDGDEFSEFWTIQSFNNSVGLSQNPTVLMQYSQNNIYVESDPDNADHTWLTLRTARLKDFQTAAEMDSLSGGLHYLSVRMRARIRGGKGACAAMFTYRNADDIADVQEADLEVLTRDPDDRIRYTNQPSYTEGGDEISGSTSNGTMPGKRQWTEWADHRFDWTPDMSTWYFDGVQVSSISFQVPREPSQIILNAWSDGGEWTGNMSVGDEAYMQVQWLQMVYNETRKDNAHKKRGLDGHVTGLVNRLVKRENKCGRVCSIDNATTLGQPVVLSDTENGGYVRRPELQSWTVALLLFVTFASSVGGL